jgi:predicted oxidoreductase (fatty acid repression mutant protein)
MSKSGSEANTEVKKDVLPAIDNAVQAMVDLKDNVNPEKETVEGQVKAAAASTPSCPGSQCGGKRLKKVAVLLKKAAEKLPALSDIKSKVLKSKVKTAKKKLLKASAKAKKASKKVMKAGNNNNNSRRNSRKSKSSRK